MLLLVFTFEIKAQSTNRNFHEKRVAFTIDDLPFSLNYLPWNEKREHVQKFLRLLEEYKIQSTVFLIGSYVTDENWEIITDFIDKGHQLGNHTYFHSGTNGVSAKQYMIDVLLCDKIMSIIKDAHSKNRIPKLGVDVHQKAIFDVHNNFEKYLDNKNRSSEKIYFRYPYLKRGNSRMKRDSIYNFLNETNHIIAPVSITSHDWKFADGFFEAYKLNDQAEMDRIGDAYVNHVISQVKESFKHSRRELGLAIDHVFLMHMNLINVFHFDRILKWFAENDWEFITLEEAVQDRFYSWEDSYHGSEGIPWLYRAKKIVNSLP